MCNITTYITRNNVLNKNEVRLKHARQKEEWEKGNNNGKRKKQ